MGRPQAADGRFSVGRLGGKAGTVRSWHCREKCSLWASRESIQNIKNIAQELPCFFVYCAYETPVDWFECTDPWWAELSYQPVLLNRLISLRWCLYTLLILLIMCNSTSEHKLEYLQGKRNSMVGTGYSTCISVYN